MIVQRSTIPPLRIVCEYLEQSMCIRESGVCEGDVIRAELRSGIKQSGENLA